MYWIFLVLSFTHYLLDFPLQGNFLSEYKSKSNYILFVHSFIWAMGISIVLNYFGIFAWWKLFMLMAGHFLMDGWKCRQHYKKFNISDINSLYIDQTFHILQIMLCLL